MCRQAVGFCGIVFDAGILFAVKQMRAAGTALAKDQPTWNDREKIILRFRWPGFFDPLSVDPSQRYSDNPEAAAFGRKLFSTP